MRNVLRLKQIDSKKLRDLLKEYGYVKSEKENHILEKVIKNFEIKKTLLKQGMY